ncbi:AEC family transporter [Alkalicaulis satelles]|uniref:AEC family transporter n=1 Tax=Alkalicaulis satelles TaxID=2609175 RepID=A0A5M6ZQG0_9PROT|nr:AEC family transporter [Alkalicaulis satelles]KAA5804491.1 AEC family transporter [Alkalicaulis satelles]
MSALTAALIPVFGVIALGWLLRRTRLVRAELWGGVNRLCYQALLPALLFSTIASADYDGLQAGPFLIAVTLGFVVMAVVSLALKPLIADGPAFTSVFQGGVRWNGFVLLALAAPAFGAEGAALAALVFAPTVPLINVMCVAVLSVWGASDRAPDLKQVAWRIAANPLILGCLAGLAANLSGLFQDGVIADTIALVGRAALPLLLLAIGAGLDFSALKARPRLLALAVALKLIAAPLAFYALGLAFGVEGVALAVLVAVGATPGAAAAYVLASEMGGDARLTAGHVTATTLLAFIAMPFWIWLAGG